MGITAMSASIYLDRPLIDPDGFLGPTWLRLPLLAVIGIVLDIVPRALWKSRFRWVEMKRIASERWSEHWTRDRTVVTVVGTLSFYITYVCYRNLKGFLPLLLGEEKFDRELHLVDRALLLGHEPANVIHGIFGDNVVTANFLSFVYLAYLPMVPISVAIWLVWSKNLRMGYWFTIATCLTWGIGTFAYYALPTLGPGFQYLQFYSDLPNTGAKELMDSLFYGREQVLRRDDEQRLNSIGGFASLHTAITLLWAIMVMFTTRTRWIHWVAWVNFAITVVATLYFGWHYIADDLGGAVIAIFSVYVGARLSGFTFDKRRTDLPRALPAKQWPDGDPMKVEPQGEPALASSSKPLDA